MGKKSRFILEGLDCTSCALKIEDNVKEIDGVKDVSVSFSNKIMSIETDSDSKLVLKDVKELINHLEPDVKVIDKKDTDIKNHQDQEDHIKVKLIRMSIGIIPFILALIFKLPTWARFTFFLISYIIVGINVLKKAVFNTIRGQIFDENFLMAIATIGAFIIGEYPEGVAVMLFYEVGELFQGMAVHRSRKSIADLMDIRPDYANLRELDAVIKVSPQEVEPGDIIIIRAGEKIPLDGRIIEGMSSIDTSALTGESAPRQVKVGDEVLGGFINHNGLLAVEVTKPYGESTVSKILDLVENAGSKKASTENFITRFARYYTPVIVFSALAVAILPPLFLSGASFTEWTYKALVFLVISCPCALVISIPLGFFGGIGGASRHGILVKGGNYLEAMTQIDTVIFDKTGTLTKGKFEVTDIQPEPHMREEELLAFAAIAEIHSNHPIAMSIIDKYGQDVDTAWIKSHEEIPGHGIKVKTYDHDILAGNTRLMELEGINYNKVDALGTLVYLAIDGKYAGHILVSDKEKHDSAFTIEQLKKIGIKNIGMFTGDTKEVGERIAHRLGIDMVYSELLPHEKVEKLEELEKNRKTKNKLVFVGDGINDAPVLARADVGIAMGGLGSDAAIEAADIVLMTDEPSKLIHAITISRRTKVIIWQNILLALGVKGIVLLMGLLGMATMWAAVFADVGVALIAVFNSMRAARTIKPFKG